MKASIATVPTHLILLAVLLRGGWGLLYAKDSASREVKEINGLWHFRADFSTDRDAGFQEQWYKQPLAKSGDVILMPVPSSFNDITQNVTLRDFIGWVWYDREFWVPKVWKDGNTRIMLRFESAHYNTIAWVNGIQVANHSGGHLPFEGDVTDFVKTGVPNTVTVAINNTVGPHTLPPGSLSFKGPPQYPEGYVIQNVNFDFFNYAGLHRPVKLYTTPSAVYVEDITVTSKMLSNGSASVGYTVQVAGTTTKPVTIKVTLMERMGGMVAWSDSGYLDCVQKSYGYGTPQRCMTSDQGSLVVATPELWWPWTMSDNPGHLYVFQVRKQGQLVACTGNVDGSVAASTEDGISDMYRLPVGIRTVEVTRTQFLINGKPFYFTGFDKHEDADIRGKGLDYPLIVKDINLIQWLGGNSFRTSHYPYAEELMDLCDKMGIVVIDESPAVGLHTPENFANETLDHHIAVMHELIQRDKNRPSVVMWSLANEPDSSLPEAVPYFKEVAEVTRGLDPTRPITFACNKDYDSDLVTQFVDVIAINRYYGWYDDTGHPETIPTRLSYDLDQWYSTHSKPIMISEYGAGTIAGIHEDPPMAFTEDYQLEVLASYFPTFDEYRKKFLVGELIWNFADFQTEPSTTRVDGNKKGILTRQRQPKAAARLLRQRYHAIAQGKELCYDSSIYSFTNHC